MTVDAISVRANAKINLHLEVLGTREDGFHDIKSVFHKISLADELLVKPFSNECRCIIHSPKLKLEEENTLTKAYLFFSEKTGIKSGVEVFLLKNIPVGAGLGGGSSDAAALLKALNCLFKCGLSKEILQAIALNVGSDVPFFLEEAPAAFVSGRGEKIEPFSADKCFGVLVVPDIFSSTGKAYKLLDSFYEKNRKESLENPCIFCGKDFCEMPFFNSFEKPLFEVFPQIAEIKKVLIKNGADFAMMSGSGSAVYGLYKSEKTAAQAYFELAKQWNFCKFFILLA